MDYKWQIFIDDGERGTKGICEKKSKSVTNLQIPDLIMQTTTEIKQCGPLKRQIKRSYSHNSEISFCMSARQHRKRNKKVVRKTKTLDDVPNCQALFWNWQLETGMWSELTVDVPLETERKNTNSTERRKTDNPEITIVNPSSSSLGKNFCM